MRRPAIFLFCALLTSCERSEYAINIQHTTIERIYKNGGRGFIIVDKEAAENMARYGDVYVSGKFCPTTACKPFPIGSVDKYAATPFDGGVKLKVEFPSEASRYNDYPPFWLKDVACLKINASKGFMGRTGRSDWNCSIKIHESAL